MQEEIEVDVVHVGRVWNFTTPHIVQANLIDYLKKLRKENFRPKILHWMNDMPESPVLLLVGGFQLPGGKNVLRTKALIRDAVARNAIIIWWTIDIELLRDYESTFQELKPIHGLVTNFKRPWRLWDNVYQFEDYQTPTLEEYTQVPPGHNPQPKVTLGYVGRPKPARMKTLKNIGYSKIVMIGAATDNQKHFDYICPEGSVHPHMWELYSKSAWSLCLSDGQHGRVQSAVNRLAEAWNCRVPILFHKSMVDTRPDVNWNDVKDFVFETADQLHEKSHVGLQPDGSFDIEKLESIARYQREMLYDRYYDGKSTARASTTVLRKLVTGELKPWIEDGLDQWK